MPALLLIKIATNNNVPVSAGQWKLGDTVTITEVRNFSTFSPAEQNNFFHITITDQTVQEAEASGYLYPLTSPPYDPNLPDAPYTDLSRREVFLDPNATFPINQNQATIIATNFQANLLPRTV
jgi:hypothetical protein